MSVRITWVRLLGLSTLLGTAACVAHVPPPPVPDKVIPEVATKPDPPASDQGQVTIDTTNGPATVSVVLMGFGYSGALTKNLCATTPCTANLPIGSFDLVFSGKGDPTMASSDAVQVTRTPSIMRHTIGNVQSSPGLLIGGITLVTLGGSGVLVGGLGLTSEYSSTTSSLLTLGVSAAITVAGALMMSAGRTRIQPGSSVQWTPEGAVPFEKPAKQQAIRLSPDGMGFTF
jgi:hypothetical protein